MDDPKIIRDPHTIQEGFPLIVFSDHTSGLIEWVIKLRTKGEYNHVMWAVHRGHFVSQGNTYSEIGMERYMKMGNRLLFIRIKNLSQEQARRIKDSIEKRLKLPWWRKLYDWPGIVGQAIGIKGIQLKGLNYCSQDIYMHLMAGHPYSGTLLEAVNAFEENGSPQDHRRVMRLFKDIFEPVYIWQSDLSDQS